MTVEKRCEKCGAPIPEDAESCYECGAAANADRGLEIEVYDFKPAPAQPSDFEKTLAQTRAVAGTRPRRASPDLTADPVVGEEIKQGFDIRRRRAGYRLSRPRNIAILAVSAAALTALVVLGVKWTVGWLPKYEYARPAHAGATDRVLEFAAALESEKVDGAAISGGPVSLLTVVGSDGRIFVDGYYVGDAPCLKLPVPVGRRHLLVKDGHDVALDETLDFREGERYTLEAAAAGALSAAPIPPSVSMPR